MAGKVRFVITANSHESEIFSVDERNDDTLGLYIRASQTAQAGSPTYHNTDDHRISIHPTPEQTYCSINQHLKCEGQPKGKFVARVEPLNGTILWPVLMGMLPNLDSATYAFNAKQKDEIVHLGKYEPSLGTLCFVLFVSSSGLKLRPSDRMNYAFRDFRFFSLHIYWCFMAMPSTNQGSFRSACSEIINEFGNGVVTKEGPSHSSRSISRGRISTFVNDFLRDAATHQVSQARLHFVINAQPVPEAIGKFAGKFSKEPFLRSHAAPPVGAA